MSHLSSEQRAAFPQHKPKLLDPPPTRDILPVRCETSTKEMNRHQGAPTLMTMSMRKALEACDAKQLSEISPVTLASMSKNMWTAIKLLSADANRWRLLRRRACLLDRRMLDGPYRTPEPEIVRDDTVMELDQNMEPRRRLAVAMDQIISKWTVVPYSDDLQGPEKKEKEQVLDSADFYVDSGRVHRGHFKRLSAGQRRWEKEISAQLLLYRLCLMFREAPTFDAGAWLFILKADNDAEIWFADHGNFHWFLAVCPTDRAMESIVELLELLISDRCVIRYTTEPVSNQPTAGETIGAAWSR